MIRLKRELLSRNRVLSSPSTSDCYEPYGMYQLHYGEDGKTCIVYGEGRGWIRIQ
jgi:hypothetical protein